MIISTQAQAQNKAEGLYKIYDTKTKKEVTVNDIATAFSTADVLFYGEEHDDSIGHILEAQILEAAYKKMGDKVTLSMEMFERDVQQVVNEYLAGLISEKNLIKEGRAWKTYTTDYKPMVEYAKVNNLELIAANTPPRYTNAVTRGGLEVLGKFDDDAKRWLPPLPIDTATGKYYENFLEIMGGHGEMPGMHIYQSQNLWDATMAWSIYSYTKKNPKQKIFQVNGRFHSDSKLGTAAQLNKYAKGKLNILNISSFYDDNYTNPDWKKYEGLGDFIIVTKKFKKDE
jgi:uncharacterized iron-regulated protein